MCDELDALEGRRAAEEDFARRKRVLQEQAQAKLPEILNCIDPSCGEPLPPLRVAGKCRYCVDCQQRIERLAVRKYRAI